MTGWAWEKATSSGVAHTADEIVDDLHQLLQAAHVPPNQAVQAGQEFRKHFAAIDGVSVNGAAATVRFCYHRDRISRRSGRSFRLGA